MFERIAPLLLVAACALEARAEPPRPSRIIPAMDAVQAGKSLAIWAPDLRAVLGYDPDGTRRWRVPTGDQGGVRDLDVLGPNVLAYAGREAILIAPDSGTVLGRRDEVRLGVPGGAPGCRIEIEEGACALVCECSFQLLRCEDLTALGPRARLPRFEELDEDGRRSSHCATFSATLVGRAGDVVIASMPAASDQSSVAVDEVLVALNSKDGGERWRSTKIQAHDEALSGIAGGGICYAGGRDRTLTVFNCQRGEILWRSNGGRPPQGELQVAVSRHGILVRRGREVTMHEAKGGSVRWKAEVPITSIVLLSDAGAMPGNPDDRYLAGGIRGARVLSADRGQTLGDIAFQPGTRRWPRRFGPHWLALSEKRVDAYDERGKALGGIRSSRSLSGYVIGNAPHVVAWDGETIMLSSLPSPRPKVVIDAHGGRVVAYEGALGPRRLAVMVDGSGPWDPKDPSSFGELRLYRWD